ncbi:hypothetical protein GCL60_11395 [Silvanigrella paludirubra]|uniref:Uncharacterized protein n=1 Tax=Silvanigrella paludirubra TaxID=2499159 RepID=A0A6N6VUB4_9BACT|nr:hypothetical protein [Silvanigrella paludirubra]KAB8037771.1 hypothetical protein GCL60_11395 [Silvanigrella paludirubra]
MLNILNEVMLYNNDNIINKFTKDYDKISLYDSQIIFKETLKWLWLCNESYLDKNENVNIFIYEDSLIIDKMWHNFILFTKDYHEFCHKYFGRFIHHEPNVDQDKENIYFERDLTNMYSYIYDKLGEETLNLWFREFPEKYNLTN